jgi:hypothetical protein
VRFQSANPQLAHVSKVLCTGVGVPEEQLKRISKVHRKQTLVLFGADMREGLQGAIRRETPASITFFAKEEEILGGTPAVDIYQQHLHGNVRIQHVAITSGGLVNIAANVVKKARRSGIERLVHGCIIQFERLAELKVWMDNNEYPPPRNMIEIPSIQGWKHVISNSISSTALTFDGEIYTWATDRRFSECLGRDPDEEPAEVPARIPYFSETKIVKIATGGYMTAALSEDGELFLWGRSCPGANGELSIFKSEKPKEPTPPRHEKSPSPIAPLPTMNTVLSLRLATSQRWSNPQPPIPQASPSNIQNDSIDIDMHDAVPRATGSKRKRARSPTSNSGYEGVAKYFNMAVEDSHDSERTKRKRDDIASSSARTPLSLPQPKFSAQSHSENAPEVSQGHASLLQKGKNTEQPVESHDVNESHSENIEHIYDDQDTYDDPYVKLVEIDLHGHPARITDVAVGNGHIIVAAETITEQDEVSRAVGIGRSWRFS